MCVCCEVPRTAFLVHCFPAPVSFVAVPSCVSPASLSAISAVRNSLRKPAPSVLVAGRIWAFRTFPLCRAVTDPDSQPLCQPCRLAAPAFVKAVAYGGYHGELRSLVHLLKYEGMQPVAGRLGRLLADSLEAFASSADAPRQMLVIPVPMHPVKQRQRGFNHAELLARAAMAEMRRRHPQLDCIWKPAC